MEGGAGGNTGQNAFGHGQALGRPERVLVLDGHDPVIYGGIEYGRNEAGADALDLVGARPALGKDRRTGRLDRDDLDPGLLALQIGATPVRVPPVPTPAMKIST